MALRRPDLYQLALLVFVLAAAPFAVAYLLYEVTPPVLPRLPAPAQIPPPARLPPASPGIAEVPAEREAEDVPDAVIAEPWRRVATVIRGNVAADPVLRDYDLVVEDREPYLVFVDRAGIPDAEAVARETMDLLQAFYREVLDRLGTDLALRPLAELANDDMRALRVAVFTETEFAKYQTAIGAPMSPGVVAYYSFTTRWLAIQWPPAEDAVSRVRVLSLAFHQLMHVFRKAAVEDDLKEDVVWNDPRLRARLLAIEDGVADFLASCREKPGGGYEFLVPNRERLGCWKRTRRGHLSEWTLPELLDITGRSDLREKAGIRWEVESPRLELLFIAEAATFCRFLWFFEDGKYRPKLLEYLRHELRGNSGPKVFREVWGKASGDTDWSALSAEFEAYVQQQWKEIDK